MAWFLSNKIAKLEGDLEPEPIEYNSSSSSHESESASFCISCARPLYETDVFWHNSDYESLNPVECDNCVQKFCSPCVQFNRFNCAHKVCRTCEDVCANPFCEVKDEVFICPKCSPRCSKCFLVLHRNCASSIEYEGKITWTCHQCEIKFLILCSRRFEEGSLFSNELVSLDLLKLIFKQAFVKRNLTLSSNLKIEKKEEK